MEYNTSAAAKIAERLRLTGVLEQLSTCIGGSGLNTLLLEIFRRRAEKLSPSALLGLYRANRLVQPSRTPVLALRELEYKMLLVAQNAGFELVELSPAAQLGACSVIAPVHQDKVLSALRNCEIMADSTNALALHDAALQKSAQAGTRDYASVSRLLRTPKADVKGHSAHFSIACLVSAGKDAGNFNFEASALVRQFDAHCRLLTDVFGFGNIRFALIPLGGDGSKVLAERCAAELRAFLPHVCAEIRDSDLEQNYYDRLQVKIDVCLGDTWYEVADGGCVNWAAKLLNNKKQRMFTSGLGLEYLLHLKNNSG
ncbi:hypothetical protein [Pedobacter sp. SYP-B3415]|uniref:hypothetical protein n=1 Tax=Pedobacter sp. SYP-B3415 TaxID=2496641 RepID=UPI00101DF007|nr:hypothetical protein [Pedobacter sp. SYP-B3415]